MYLDSGDYVFRETSALISTEAAVYTFINEPAFGDMVRETGSDGEIWRSDNTPQVPENLSSILKSHPHGWLFLLVRVLA